ncbi:ubiquitin-like domain-containing protein [Candidatus Saccharibacteria bacterium]|nr:ubiquitin-like domain-containing protein [Candidatus Saccharibacteria bacterium]
MTLRSRKSTCFLGVVFFASLFLLGLKLMPQTFADEKSSLERAELSGAEHYVTIFDESEATSSVTSKRTVKTDASTVAELFDRLHLTLDSSDSVSPALETPIDTPDFFITIHRSFPVLILDGSTRKFTAATSRDPKLAVLSAGFTLYETDSVSVAKSASFLEAGLAIVYEISRGEDYKLAHSEKTHTATLASDFKAELAASLNVPRLTAAMGRNRYVGRNLSGELVERQETYYDLPMSGVMAFCGQSSYTVRDDGAKVDPDGYVLVAASLSRYPRCSVVETSLGLGKVYDTGTFALANPEQFDLATDWTNHNGV